MKLLIYAIIFSIVISSAYAEGCLQKFCTDISYKALELSDGVSKSIDYLSRQELKSFKKVDKESIEEALKISQYYHLNRSNEETIADTLCQSPYEHPVKVARSPVDRRVYLHKLKEEKQCNFSNLMKAASSSEEEFVAAIRETNFNPCCLPMMSLISISSTDKHVKGFTIGVEGSVGAGPLGADLGKEIIIMQTSNNEFDIALVSYKGPEASVGLPFGVSVTQGIVTGNCRKIDDYLGVFSNFDIGGLQYNTGLTESAFSLSAKGNGCNAESVVSGATTDIIGFSETNYTLSSKIIRIKGPRLHKLRDYLNRTNMRSSNRRKLKDNHIPQISYLAEDFLRRVKGSKDGFEDPVTKECTYDIDDQVKDFIGLE